MKYSLIEYQENKERHLNITIVVSVDLFNLLITYGLNDFPFQCTSAVYPFEFSIILKIWMIPKLCIPRFTFFFSMHPHF